MRRAVAVPSAADADTPFARALDALPRGATAISDFSPLIEEAIEKGWLYASLQFGGTRVRTGHLVYGMLRTATLRNALLGISGEWRKVNAERLADGFDTLLRASSEAGGASEALAPGDACIAWDGGGLTLDAAARAAAIREEMAALLGDDPARISHPANLAAPAPPIMNG